MSSKKDLTTKKLELIQWVAEAGEEYLIDEMLKMTNAQSQDWWAEISDEERKAIEEGLADENTGNFLSHEDAKKTWEKWLIK